MNVSPDTAQMEIENLPLPENLLESLWVGWRTDFAPGVLADKRSWRQES
jgi:hypothetical protein